jgi:hypothetical protein
VKERADNGQKFTEGKKKHGVENVERAKEFVLRKRMRTKKQREGVCS